MDKARAYFQLLKFRLSFTVAFSSALGYLLGAHTLSWSRALLVLLGGLLVTGSANIINQVFEKDLDKLMHRTENRPLPTGRISPGEAWVFCALLGAAGLGCWCTSSTRSRPRSRCSRSSSTGSFTRRSKRCRRVCVAVGAIPGGLPPLIGWVAATRFPGSIPLEAWVMFGIQFMWQFPHFWAIAWVADDDYKRAGFKMLPSPGERDLRTAFQIMTYTVLLIPVSLLPLVLGIRGRCRPGWRWCAGCCSCCSPCSSCAPRTARRRSVSCLPPSSTCPSCRLRWCWIRCKRTSFRACQGISLAPLGF